MVEETLERVGLPVRCRVCAVRGCVKPRTDYGGWWRQKFRSGTKWWCPEHADAPRNRKQALEEYYRNRPPEPEPVEAIDELYKILD